MTNEFATSASDENPETSRSGIQQQLVSMGYAEFAGMDPERSSIFGAGMVDDLRPLTKAGIQEMVAATEAIRKLSPEVLATLDLSVGSRVPGSTPATLTTMAPFIQG